MRRPGPPCPAGDAELVGLAPPVRGSSEPQAGLALLLRHDPGDGGELGARVDAALQQTRERRDDAQ
eukprot:7538328-Pyramimonas_sp.AAC.1